jgi:hypothetical protein
MVTRMAHCLKQFAPPVKRTRFASWVDARRTVGVQMSLQDYLQSRLCWYLRGRSPARAPAPVHGHSHGVRRSVTPLTRKEEGIVHLFRTKPGSL